MAPAFKGNAFIKDSKVEEIEKVLVNGRSGAAKKYKQFVIAMPKQTLNSAERKAVIAHLKSIAGK